MTRTNPNRPYHVVTLEVESGRAGALAGRIRRDLGVEAAHLARPGHDRDWLELYFDSEVKAALAETVLAARPGIRATARRVCRPRDWQEAWKRHVRPHAVGRALYLCPAGREKDRIPPGRIAVRINPGLSFGTGAHFTTRFCLEMIDQLCQTVPPGSLLDAGAGSGILAIAAARLGVARVVGIECDPLALAQARENVNRNRVAGRVTLRRLDIHRARFRGPFDVVCANVNFSVITSAWDTIRGATRRHLVLSGLREAELDAVAERAAAAGLTEQARDGDGEWGGLCFQADSERTGSSPRRTKTTSDE
jgi:ribosomal protein L11 methyltransferase